MLPDLDQKSTLPSLEDIKDQIQNFLGWSGLDGFLLILATVLALLLANSPIAPYYFDFWETPVTFEVGGKGFDKPLLLWVNDLLMAVFFLLIGLEIKREIIAGELSSIRKASLPIVAALGGMFLPVLLFFLFQPAGPGQDAWGVPMATDIAFSIGLLSIFSKRVPVGLMVFLTTFAIVDDIGAILVISLFYSHEVDWISLVYAAGWWSILLLMNTVFKLTRIWVYMLVGCGVWYSIFKAGIHPTIAGVLVALTIPTFHKGTESLFLSRWKTFIRKIRNRNSDVNLSRKFHREKEMEVLAGMNKGIHKVISPLQLLENQLENITSYFILPVFALANAGISLQGIDSFPATLTLSAGGAMLIGKVIGLFGFSWIAVKLGWANLPRGVRWPHLLGTSFLGGIGFTMAIFIANLALSDQTLLANTKIGILSGSLIAGILGVFILHRTLPSKEHS